MKKFDVVIVGSGLGGLLSGLILSKEGLSVCILEQSLQLGGLLQTFNRDGTIFDTGVHYVGSLGEGEVLNRYFKYFGIMDKLRLKKMDESGFDQLYFKGVDYKLANGYDRFVETLAEKFPKHRAELKTYIAKIQEICNSHSMYDLHEVDENKIEFSHLVLNTWDYICSLTNNETLRHILAGNNFLYAGVSTKTPMLTHSLVNNSYIKSAWKFVDGSSQLTDAIVEVIEQNGGEILTGAKVEKFVSDGVNILKVVTDEGEEIFAKSFISNLHPAQTLSMVENHPLSKPYKKRITNLENTTSAFVLFIKFKENSFKYLNSNYYHFLSDTVWTAERHKPGAKPELFFFTTPATSKSDDFADSAIILCYMSWEEVEKWGNTTIENRGDDYLAFKDSKTEELLDLVENKFPDIRACIKEQWTSTPLTFRDYTGTPKGSLYGILKDSNKPMESFISQRTKVPNLFLTGQNVNFHGVVGVTISAALTCSEFLGLNYLIRKIKNA